MVSHSIIIPRYLGIIIPSSSQFIERGDVPRYLL